MGPNGAHPEHLSHPGGLSQEGTEVRNPAPYLTAHLFPPQECKTLRNMASLHAIISAFRSVPLHRLKDTWEKVSRYVCRPLPIRVEVSPTCLPMSPQHLAPPGRQPSLLTRTELLGEVSKLPCHLRPSALLPQCVSLNARNSMNQLEIFKCF